MYSEKPNKNDWLVVVALTAIMLMACLWGIHVVFDLLVAKYGGAFILFMLVCLYVGCIVRVCHGLIAAIFPPD